MCRVIPERVASLSNEEAELIRAALTAGAEGPYFPNWEIQTLLAVSRDELTEVLMAWPEAAATTSWEPDPERVQYIAVSNVLNNLVGYPHGKWPALQVELGVEQRDLVELLERWRGGAVRSYFEAMT